MSARANALVVSTELNGPALLRSLNGLSPQLFFTAATRVPANFRVRGAIRRVYRYFEPTSFSRLESWQRLSEQFLGTVDVRSFGRALPLERPQWRTIEAVEVLPASPGLLIEVRAPSFVWGMVRKIVGALREADRGRLSPEHLSAALSGRERLTLPMAEPEPLVLWEVEYPLTWDHRWAGPNRHQTRAWESMVAEARVRSAVLSALDVGRS